MSVVSGDLVIYGAQNIAEDDVSAHGGAIDSTVRYVFDDSALANTLNDTIEVLSDNGADTTQTVTITGRDISGMIVSEGLALNGTNVISGAQNFERILKIELSASASGTVTVREATGDTTLVNIETGVTSVRRPFYNVSSDISGGSSRDFYEKVFLKNNNSTNALLSASISENADTLSKITFDLEDSVDDNNSVASRLNTAPTGMLGSFDNTSKSVPGSGISPGSAIGIWMKLTLAAGDPADKGTWTVAVSGSTT